MYGIELPGLEPHQHAELLPLRPIFVAYRGSVAHGTYVPPEDPSSVDDIDLISIHLEPLERYFGVWEEPTRSRQYFVGRYDCEHHEVRRFVGLLAKGNPNVMATLWQKPEVILYKTAAWDMIHERRHLFATKVAYTAFSGYAFSQLKRMTSFKDVEPGACGCTGEFHEAGCAVAQAAGRGSTKRFATGYMGEKRKALVREHGYDCKNASHLLRLLTMGIEFMRTGEFVVDRRDAGDAQKFVDIKKGRWTLADVQKDAEDLFARFEAEAKASRLPDEPDREAIDRLGADILCREFAAEIALRSNALLALPLTGSSIRQ